MISSFAVALLLAVVMVAFLFKSLIGETLHHSIYGEDHDETAFQSGLPS